MSPRQIARALLVECRPRARGDEPWTNRRFLDDIEWARVRGDEPCCPNVVASFRKSAPRTRSHYRGHDVLARSRAAILTDPPTEPGHRLNPPREGTHFYTIHRDLTDRSH